MEIEPDPLHPRDVWGFRHAPDGTAYMTHDDLDEVAAGMPATEPADMFALLGAIKTMGDRELTTDERLDALRRLREAGLVNDAQARHVIGTIFEGR